MGTVLLTILLLLLALGALLLALLFVPADFTISTGTRAGFRFRVRWLFGLVRVGPAGQERAARPRPAPVEARAAKEGPPGEPARRRPRSRRRAARTAGRLLTIEGLASRAGKLARDGVRSLGWRRLRVSVRAGTGDPADTGELCGLVGSVLACLPGRPSLRVEFEPDFVEPVFDAEAEGAGRFVPARLVGALARFAMSRPGRRAIKVLVWDRGR